MNEHLARGNQKKPLDRVAFHIFEKISTWVFTGFMSEPIKFVETRFQYLSPFSAHSIVIWGETFPTVEHAYQASRIKHGPERDCIKNASSPLDAWRLGQKFKSDPNLRVECFDKEKIMEELFRAKMAQHSDIVDILKESGDRELIKNYDTDYFWGVGKDGSGQNKMGKLWMKLRSELSI